MAHSGPHRETKPRGTLFAAIGPSGRIYNATVSTDPLPAELFIIGRTEPWLLHRKSNTARLRAAEKRGWLVAAVEVTERKGLL